MESFDHEITEIKLKMSLVKQNRFMALRLLFNSGSIPLSYLSQLFFFFFFCYDSTLVKFIVPISE